MTRAKKVFNGKLEKLGFKVENELGVTKNNEKPPEICENTNNVEFSEETPKLHHKSCLEKRNSTETEVKYKNSMTETRKSESFEYGKEILNDSWFSFSPNTMKNDTKENIATVSDEINNIFPSLPTVDNLTANLSRVSISPSNSEKISSTSFTDSQVLNFLNISSPKIANLSKNKSETDQTTPTLFGDDDFLETNDNILKEIDENNKENEQNIACSQDLFAPNFKLRRRRDSTSTPVLPKKRMKNKENSEIFIDLCENKEIFDKFLSILKPLEYFSISFNQKIINDDDVEFNTENHSVTFCTEENVCYKLKLDKSQLHKINFNSVVIFL